MGHHWAPEASEASCGIAGARRGLGTQDATPVALRRDFVRHLRPGDPAPSGPPLGPWGTLWKGVVVLEREGSSDKTGVGRAKDNGAATVQHKSPGRSCKRTRHLSQP